MEIKHRNVKLTKTLWAAVGSLWDHLVIPSVQGPQRELGLKGSSCASRAS